MTTFTIVFTAFVLYTTACCMDGPDLKPLWKKWLGVRLENYANHLKPISYCKGVCCHYYRLANESLPLYEKLYTQLIDEIAKTNALNSHPIIEVRNYDAIKLENRVLLDECTLRDARMFSERATRGEVHDTIALPSMSVPFLVEDAKRRCVEELLNEAKQFATVKVDEESRWPNIIITARMLVGKRQDY